jgi:hypothetical protein
VAIHFEIQQVPVLALTLIKSGKMRPVSAHMLTAPLAIPRLRLPTARRQTAPTCSRPFVVRTELS